jgi:hypothetical protein
MQYSEPVVVFVSSSEEGLKLAKKKDWQFIGGKTSSEFASGVAEAFRKDHRKGIVVTYGWALTGLNLRRPGTAVILTEGGTEAMESQGRHRVGMNPTTIYATVEDLLSGKLSLSAVYTCSCEMKVILLQGCQCGGV